MSCRSCRQRYCPLRTSTALVLAGLVTGTALIMSVTPTRRHLQSTSGLQREFADTLGETLEITGHVRWRLHPDKCWDYSHLKHSKPHNGMNLQMYTCGDRPDNFVVPVRGAGHIKIAGHEEYCLDRPNGAHGALLQLWNCQKSPNVNTMFTLSGKGTFHLWSNASMCIDVPYSGSIVDVEYLRMWSCRSQELTEMHFSVHVPVDCQWTDWGHWSNCSEECGGGHRIRTRSKEYGLAARNSKTGARSFLVLRRATKPAFNGRPCVGPPEELKPCGSRACPEGKSTSWFWESH